MEEVKNRVVSYEAELANEAERVKIEAQRVASEQAVQTALDTANTDIVIS